MIKDLSLTAGAEINPALFRQLAALDNRFLSLLVAVGTKPWAWLATFHQFLVKRVYKNTRSDFLKRIAAALSFPVFHLSNFLFEIVFLARQILISRLESKNRVLDVDDFSV